MEWISVKDRLPDEEQDVLLLIREIEFYGRHLEKRHVYHSVYIGWCIDGEWATTYCYGHKYISEEVNNKCELVKFIVAQVAAGASNRDYRFEEIIEHNFEDDENIDSYINEHWSDNSGRMLMAMAYALCQRTYEKLSFIYVEYSRKTISRKNSPDLNKFYALLCKLGYVMSDEEIQLRDGTHPIFITGEVK